MAKAMRRLQKKVRAEQAQIAKAAKKRGLWSSLGSALVGGVAMLATGGAASPFVAGLFAGGASAVGGHLGNYLAGQSPGGKLKGGRFFQGQRADLSKQIKDKINVGAVKTALKVGGMKLMGKMGGKLKVGKGGVSAELPMGEIAKGTETAATKTNIFESIFKGGDTGTALTKGGKVPIGNLIDFKGSTLGKGLQHIQSNIAFIPGQDETMLRNLGQSQSDLVGQELGIGTELQGATLDAGSQPSLETIVKGDMSLADLRSQTLMPSEGGTRLRMRGIDLGMEYPDIGTTDLGAGTTYPIGDPKSWARSETYATDYLQGEYDRIVPGVRRSAEIAQSERIQEGLKNYEFGPGSPKDTVRGYFPDVDLEDKVPLGQLKQQHWGGGPDIPETLSSEPVGIGTNVEISGMQMPDFQTQPRTFEDLGNIAGESLKAPSRSYSLQGARDARYKNLFGR